ncbi:hypothetical protein Tco_1203571 [Tanacetum coccineum]
MISNLSADYNCKSSLAMLPRWFQIGHEENRIRKDTNAGRISTKGLERRMFLDVIRKFVSKIFCIPSVIVGKKLRTIGRNDGILDKEEAALLTPNASNDFRKKVRDVFLISLGEVAVQKKNVDSVENEGVVNEEVEIREEQVVNQTENNDNKANEGIDDSVDMESVNIVMDDCGDSPRVIKGNNNGFMTDNTSVGKDMGRMNDNGVELDDGSPSRKDCNLEQTNT